MYGWARLELKVSSGARLKKELGVVEEGLELGLLDGGKAIKITEKKFKTRLAP